MDDLAREIEDLWDPYESTHGSKDDIREGAGATITPQPTSTVHALPKMSRPYRDPPIYDSVRQVLSAEPTFAESVILAIERLPPNKRDSLVDRDETTNTDGNVGPLSEPLDEGDRPSKRSRTDNCSNVDHGDGPSGGGGTGEGIPEVRNTSNQGTGRKEDDDEGSDDKGRGGNRSPSLSKERNENKKRRWICPFELAYPEIHRIPHFSHCSSGNMTEKHLWKSHFNTHHSPMAKLGDPESDRNARFYMDQGQLYAVLHKISSHKGRPRGIDQWNKHCTDLFLKVWYTIFPKDPFPHLKKPLSAFHPEDGETCNLGQRLASQAGILVGAMYDAKAHEAMTTGVIASKDDYQLSAGENVELISNAIAIALLNSPAATGATHWLAHASPDMIRSAGRESSDGSLSQSMAFPLEEEAAAGPSAPPLLAVLPGAAHQAFDSTKDSQMVPIPLFPGGTLLEIQPYNSTNTQRAYLTVPSNWYVASTRPAPNMAPPLLDPVFGPPFDITPPDTVSPHQLNWNTNDPPASECVSLHAVEGGSSAQQDFSV
ncbi:unnamed protein product [Fusarium equiseti]|uniref:Uncharacterized protein n=1 Tax=Fusarium equiseti TaxID=61235 RepID=A0A8J2IIJ7_FUSEQ|nr:unnamed protein product [Fusarium equiseti]